MVPGLQCQSSTQWAQGDVPCRVQDGEFIKLKVLGLARGSSTFPTDDALKKMFYLATLDLKGSFRNKRDWPVILGALQVAFKDRIEAI